MQEGRFFRSLAFRRKQIPTITQMSGKHSLDKGARGVTNMTRERAKERRGAGLSESDDLRDYYIHARGTYMVCEKAHRRITKLFGTFKSVFGIKLSR